MTTYMVGSIDCSNPIEPVGGLSLEDGIELLMELSGSIHGLQRINGEMRMAVHPLPAFCNKEALTSTLPDDDAAIREIFLNFVTGKAGLMGSFTIIREREHA